MTSAEHPQSGGLLASVKEAILGSTQDYTEGSISRAITLLSIPMVLEMMMESLFGVVDVFFVAKLGPNAVATVGLTESLLAILFAIALGLSMATTAVVSRRIGEKKPEEASTAAFQAILVGIVISIVIGCAGALYGPRLLGAMGADRAIIETGSAYTRTILGASGTILFLFLLNAVFRGAGDAAIAMRTLWLANLINILLNPCLIFGLGPFPRMGVLGSAVGTTIGRGAGVLFQLYMLWSGKRRISIRPQHLRLDLPVLFRILRLSLGGMFQYFVAVASWVGLVRIVALFGSVAIAGYTLGLRIIVFAILPSWGMSNAAATLVGQNLGAGKPERAEKAAWTAGFYNMLFLGTVAVIFLIAGDRIVSIFTSDAAVATIASTCLRILSYGYVAYGYGMVMVQCFNGAGDTLTPTVINICCYWLFQIPLAYALAMRAGMGPSGVFTAIAVSESVIAVVAVLAFRRGKWKLQKV